MRWTWTRRRSRSKEEYDDEVAVREGRGKLENQTADKTIIRHCT
jgi:hypothetical protein